MIFTIVWKNLKIIFRSPFTVLLLILSPILLMFIVGFTYSGHLNLSETNIGLINTDPQIFANQEMNFIHFNSPDNKYNAVNNCVKELEKSNIDLCIDFDISYDENNKMKSAKVVYYVDNTRPQISNILINSFNKIIAVKTKEISEQTVTQIFKEINNTAVFMRESKNLINKIIENIDIAKTKINDVQSSIVTTKNNFELIKNDLKNTENNLIGQINTLQSNQDNVINEINDLSSQLQDSKNELNKENKDIQDRREKVEYLITIFPEAANYISVSDLKDIEDSLNYISENIANTNTEIANTQNTLKFSFNTENMKNQINGLLNKVDEIEQYIDSSSLQLKSFETILENKEINIKDANDKIEVKLEYFENLAHRDPSEITEPISKKYILLFNNFKRVHQLSPAIIVLILLFIGLLLSNVIVSMEVNSKAYFRNAIAPVKQWQFVLALFLTSFIMIIVQVLFLFIILKSFFGIEVFMHFGVLLLIISHMLFVFILIGMICAYLFSSVQISILVTTFIILFMFLLSDVIVPLEIMPPFFMHFLKFNPVVVGEKLIRLVFFFKDYKLNFAELLIFYPYIFFLIIVLYVVVNRRKKY